MTWSRIEYFLNAILYCLWLADKKVHIITRKYIEMLLSPIPKYLFTENYRKKCYENREKQKPLLDDYFNNKVNGFHIGMANHLFGSFYSCYSLLISFIVLAKLLRIYEDLNKFIVLITFAIPIIVAYIPAYTAVFKNDRYLKYFKQFENEDENWHKKWKRITITFCIGGVIALLLGIVLAWVILLS